MYSYLENYISFWFTSSEKKTKGLLTFIFIIRFWPQFSLFGTVFYSSVQLLPSIQIRICNKRLFCYVLIHWSEREWYVVSSFHCCQSLSATIVSQIPSNIKLHVSLRSNFLFYRFILLCCDNTHNSLMKIFSKFHIYY